jgi:hypothetical protein
MKQAFKITLIIIIGCTSFTAICQTSEDKKTEIKSDSLEIKKFWGWFKKNEKSLKDFEKNRDTVLNQILNVCSEINPNITIELESGVKGVINFTFSTNGDPDLIPIVQEIVKRAPKIKGWNFIAFRQKITTEQLKTKVLEIDKKKFDPNTIKFKATENENKLDLIIYAKGISRSNFTDVSYQLSILIDQVLGEYNCAMQINQIDYEELPKDKKLLSELKSLLELADYVDAFYKK